jgi:hypothetical protein
MENAPEKDYPGTNEGTTCTKGTGCLQNNIHIKI